MRGGKSSSKVPHVTPFQYSPAAKLQPLQIGSGSPGGGLGLGLGEGDSDGDGEGGGDGEELAA